MGHPRSNTSMSTTLFSVSRFGTKAARATQVARAGQLGAGNEVATKLNRYGHWEFDN